VEFRSELPASGAGKLLRRALRAAAAAELRREPALGADRS